jgi:hypothetical protein
MILLHDFGISIRKYGENGKENDFPVLDQCPGCGCLRQGNLHRHGYYWRYGIEGVEHIPIPICRYKCLVCKITISILPSFLVPYFQYTLYMIMEGIKRFFNGEKCQGNRQLIAQHVKRFCSKIHWIHSFFMDQGCRMGLSEDIKKEAQKYMKMIQDIGVSSFFRRSWGHISSYFMGKLILPYLKQ